MTKAEREAQSVGRALAKALLKIEAYDGDPTDVIEEARIALSGNQPGREGAGLTLDALERYFTSDGSEWRAEN